MNLRQKIGQMLIMGFQGTTLTPHSDVIRWIKEDALGGVILFDYDMPRQCQGKNLQSISQIQALTQTLQEANTAAHPLWISVDYEGGVVNRLKKIEGCYQPLAPNMQAQLDAEAFILEAERMAQCLVHLGINVNFAPVVDLNLNNEAGIIGKLGRCYSHNAAVVSTLALQYVATLGKAGITSVYKHFPGHGSAGSDSHEDSVDVTNTFDLSELIPYRTLKDTQHPVMVMTAHVINRQLDKSGLPATLSRTIITDLLRLEFQYDGVIMSDDMQMAAISKHYSLDEALELTINAGVDVLIFGNQLGQIDAPTVIACVEGLIRQGRVFPEQINRAYERICKAKSKMLRVAKYGFF